MNTKRTLITLTILLLTTSWSFAGNGRCSTATVAGTWGFTLAGSLLTPSGPVPAAAIGRTVADVNGNLSGAEARNVGGGYADETFIGSWTVNPDCTGNMTINIYESGQLVRTSALSMVFDEFAREARMVQQSLTLPNGVQVPVVLTLEGKKQF
jgi:hypothetical protein